MALRRGTEDPGDDDQSSGAHTRALEAKIREQIAEITAAVKAETAEVEENPRKSLGKVILHHNERLTRTSDHPVNLMGEHTDHVHVKTDPGPMKPGGIIPGSSLIGPTPKIMLEAFDCCDEPQQAVYVQYAPIRLDPPTVIEGARIQIVCASCEVSISLLTNGEEGDLTS